MVSTSRKKNKGKDRKAKKEASKAETERVRARELWLGWAVGKERITGTTITCDHGFGLDLVSIELDQPITSFLDELFTGNNVAKFDSIFLTHPQLFNDERLKKKVINILTSIGTSLLSKNRNEYVCGDREHVATGWALLVARSIVVLEHHTVNGRLEDVLRSREVAKKRRDFDLGITANSGRRDTLKFYSKRASCSCLKGIHQMVRATQPKIGRCHWCNQMRDRKALSVCSRCMISQYCSRKCQVSAWDEHKEDCKQFVSVHEQQTKK